VIREPQYGFVQGRGAYGGSWGLRPTTRPARVVPCRRATHAQSVAISPASGTRPPSCAQVRRPSSKVEADVRLRRRQDGRAQHLAGRMRRAASISASVTASMGSSWASLGPQWGSRSLDPVSGVSLDLPLEKSRHHGLARRGFFRHLHDRRRPWRLPWRNASPDVFGVSFEMKPPRLDPVRNPELFEGVLSAACWPCDRLRLIMIPIAPRLPVSCCCSGSSPSAGLDTVVAVLSRNIIGSCSITDATLGSPASATIGMRVMSIEMRTWYGAPWLFRARRRACRAFYVSVSALTSARAVCLLFNERRRLLQISWSADRDQQCGARRAIAPPGRAMR